MNTAKMKVEVWSDIMCPFCYIGKRNYEAALEKFVDGDKIEIVWKSFQLDPSIPDDLGNVSVYQYLAERKGMSYEQSVKMHQQVVQIAHNAGLEYNFDKAVIANSFNAHRVIQMAKVNGLGDQAEERFFRAYFTEGKNLGDKEVLTTMGEEIGLTREQVSEALSNEEFAQRAKLDMAEAQSLGVTGVPFFVFNRRYAVSGAQPPETFLQTLERSFEEWRDAKPSQ
jgi:protein disulfide-isomerase